MPEAAPPTSPRRRLPLLALSLGLLGTAVHVVRLEGDRARERGLQRARYRELTRTGRAPAAAPAVLEAAGRLDRCPSCHAGILAPARVDGSAPLPRPLGPHPGTLLASHPPRRFGCTLCHGAGGELLDRCAPRAGDPDGAALGRRSVQASCPRCHGAPRGLPGAERLEAGLEAYRRHGCAGCHRARTLADAEPRKGPPLDGLAEKLAPSFLLGFLEDPQRVRPGTTMPSFFSDETTAGAPAFSRETVRAGRAELVRDLAAFLLALQRKGPALPPERALPEGDTARGARLFAGIGCRACHAAGSPGEAALVRDGLAQEGPDLSRAGARLSRRFLLGWLASPRALFPETRMPDPRLSPGARADLAAHLLSLGAGERRPAALPATADPRRGRTLARQLGCGGCHAVAPLEGQPPNGPDLDGFGEKPLALLDWAYHPSRPEERSAPLWAREKLEHPRAFDHRPGILTMPLSRLRAGELDGLLLVLRSLGREGAPAGLAAAPRSKAPALGPRLLRERGCVHCHTVSGSGGALGRTLRDEWDRPPPLEGEGAKTQPAWLAAFLLSPVPLRPWLALRMPTPSLDPAGAEAIASHLAASDGASFPFPAPADRGLPLEGAALDDARRLFGKLQCLRCHLLSNAGLLKPGELSPDLAFSPARFRRGWIRRFLLEPQAVLPGTKMPTYFPVADEDSPGARVTPVPDLLGGSAPRQVDALADLCLRPAGIGPAVPALHGPTP